MLKLECNVHVRRLSHGEKVRCIIDHIKPVTRNKPDHIIFHLGADDIPSDKDAEDIAKSTVDLDMFARSPTCNVSISNIITRREKHQHTEAATGGVL